MSELGPQEEPRESGRVETLLHDLPAETDVEGEEIKANIEWDKADNEFGTVEYKLYRNPESTTDKVILYVPGLGGTLQNFEQRFVRTLIEQGYDVATICRNGTVINTENRGAINSAERISFGVEHQEDHIGDLPEYGYKEWTQEMACAMVALNDHYQEFQAIGSSYGGLGGLESIRLLQERHPEIIEKLSRFVSLSGQIGQPDTDEAGERWPDPSKDYGPETLPKLLDKVRVRNGGCRMKDSQVINQEYLEIIDRIYQTDLPLSVKYILVAAEGDKYFSQKHAGIDLWQKITKDGSLNLSSATRGKAVYWYNKGEEKDPHGQKELTPKALIEMLTSQHWVPRVIHRNNSLGPEPQAFKRTT